MLALLALVFSARADPVVDAAVTRIFERVDEAEGHTATAEDVRRAAEGIHPVAPAPSPVFWTDAREERLTGRNHGGMIWDPHFGGWRFPDDPRDHLRVTVDRVSVTGGLSRSQVRTVIDRNLAQMRYCYGRELTKRPGLEGSMEVRLTVGSDGSVTSAKAAADSALAPVAACVEGRFMRFQFPGAARVSLRLEFAPGEFYL